MAPATELFADDVQVMKCLYNDYNKRTDVDAALKVEQDLNDIFETCAAREADVRQVITEMARQAQELETAAAYPHREGSHAERVAALQRQIDVAKQLIGEMDKDARSVEQQRLQMDDQLKAATKAASDAAAVQAAEESVHRYKLSMYAHVTRVTWRRDQQQVVAGTVSDLKSQDIRTFNLDPSTASKFELVNALWELL